MPLTANDKKVRRVKALIKAARANEQGLRDDAPSRSTGIRNVYKSSHDTLARVEEILNEKS